MEQGYAVEFQHVSKIYRLKSKERKHSNGQRFYALRDVSFCLPAGEALGVLGTNGSGKSTLALLLAGICQPDEGELRIRGEQALVSINTGLSAQLTGLENIRLKGALLGLPKRRVEQIGERVADFSELGDFLYQPVKKYSSGMKSRLGFSINLCLDPDILIVDEALSVGDKGFAQKCLDQMNALKKQGKTILFISHVLPQVRKFCTNALWIEGGRLREYGPVKQVCAQYTEYVDAYNALSGKEKKQAAERVFAQRVIEK